MSSQVERWTELNKRVAKLNNEFSSLEGDIKSREESFADQLKELNVKSLEELDEKIKIMETGVNKKLAVIAHKVTALEAGLEI